ncbi:HpcH/HpaI aldolase/citrate lyase family protein [Chelatococcus asaccharovorans]|uniref:HpcH/HpaI aldolase/citrate lyase family protein n=2 Tax=Chelatococcus asaccharovorans TaxID=28210 RepID=UPI00224C6C0E|nr:aldolase/citrate lyase family protein [Chelatococcus asaccharovorans]CAH1655862.1 Citrate lyase subunit beta/citryl-CoA lyase [Chelatococcus asaccharovorans]CAH1685283.1 Citrate lyase subunit beta/citryl-CoA lyase [Chelatococcus asaccharovorans]
MNTARTRFAGMRSLLEVPVLNEKFWSKVPTANASTIMLDLEDSATPDNKEAVRARIIDVLKDRSYFGGRGIVVRVNNLATPWGRDDLAALADADDDIVICYPKVSSGDEIREVARILLAERPNRGLYPMIETARAVIELDQIANAEGVVGLHFGYVDYAADVGSRPFNDAGDDLHPASAGYARTKIAVAAAAYGLFCTGGSMIPDYRDLAKVESFIKGWADVGYTACIGLSPAHLDIINRVMSPSDAEVAAASELCAAYERAVAAGAPAAVLNGKVITNPDYRVASLLLARAGKV